MNFEEMIIKLKRYSFESKMNFSQKKSMKIFMEFMLKDEHKDDSSEIFPWELEVFTLIALMAYKEYNNQEFTGNIEKDCINSIRDYDSPELLKDKQQEIVQNIFILISRIQFQCQHFYKYKMYRYNYFFNFENEKINMKLVFEKKFGVPHKEFLIFGYTLLTLLMVGTDKTYKYMIELVVQYKKVIDSLLISRENFILDQKKMTANIDEYYYGYKCFFTKPFIEYNGKVYLPLPHLLIDSMTISLLYEITEEENGLRTLFGKEVFENYLFDILNNNKIYDEIKKEEEYKIGNTSKHTSDVLICKDEYAVLFDCKMLEPSNKLRRLDSETIKKLIENYSKHIIQIYNSINISFLHEYNPFIKKNLLRKNIFGIIVPISGSMILKSNILAKVRETLSSSGIKEIDEEMKYIESNIYIFELYEIERIALSNNNIIKFLVELKNRGENDSFSLGTLKSTGESKDFKKVMNELSKSSQDKASKIIKGN